MTSDVSLILLNGPPSIGKSTLAQLYVNDHPLALNLDIDKIRRLLGRWDEGEQASGLLAREMALAMASVHLRAGHDVVIPQYLGKVDFIEQVEALAAETGSQFHELVLMDSLENTLARFAARGRDVAAAPHHDAADRLMGGPAGLTEFYERLSDVVTRRPNATVIRTSSGDVVGSYRAFLAALESA